MVFTRSRLIYGWVIPLVACMTAGTFLIYCFTPLDLRSAALMAFGGGTVIITGQFLFAQTARTVAALLRHRSAASPNPQAGDSNDQVS